MSKNMQKSRIRSLGVKFQKPQLVLEISIPLQQCQNEFQQILKPFEPLACFQSGIELISICIVVYLYVLPCIEILLLVLKFIQINPQTFCIFGMILQKNLDTTTISKQVSKFISHIEKGIEIHSLYQNGVLVSKYVSPSTKIRFDDTSNFVCLQTTSFG